MIEIFLLLIIYQIKHFLADFPLQGRYMLGKFKDGIEWIMPLAAHCSVHLVLTLGIVLMVKPSLWWLCLVDFGCHFIMDRIKAGKNLLGRWTKEQPMFWNMIGIDQMVHHFTHYYIIWMLVK
jgi:hypothetical protein